jgi:hypothetical protein
MQQYFLDFCEGQVAKDHYILEYENNCFEAFFATKSIGTYKNFYDAANAVLQLVQLSAWNPPLDQRIFSN